MVDWTGLLTNGLWILGLAVILAAFSHAYWSAHQARVRLRDELSQATFQVLFWSGLTFVCVGVALSGGRWWERVLWGGLAAMAAVQIWQSRRARSFRP